MENHQTLGMENGNKRKKGATETTDATTYNIISILKFRYVLQLKMVCFLFFC